MSRLLGRFVSRLYSERDRVVRRVLGTRGEHFEWVALDVRGVTASPTSSERQPHFVDPGELRAAPDRFWLERESVDRMLQGGDRLLAMRVGPETVYRATVMVDPTRTTEVLGQRGVSASGWIVSGVLTHASHRGRGLHAEAMRWLAGEARRAGVQLLVAWIARWNRSSRRAFARAGFRPLPPPHEVEPRRAME